MKFVVLGATGGSGLAIVKQALERGHEVIAIVRNAEKLKDIQHENFKVVIGDVFSSESLQPHFEGCDAIFSCLGSPSLIHSTTIYSAPMRAIITAMRAAKVKRIIAMSTWYVEVDPKDDPGLMARWVVRKILNKPIADLQVMEKFLGEGCKDIDYTVVKPPRLVDQGLTDFAAGKKQLVVEVTRHHCDIGGNISMSRPDVARFMLDNVDTEEHYKTFVSIGVAPVKT